MTKSFPRHALKRRGRGSTLLRMHDETRAEVHTELMCTSERALVTTGINWGTHYREVTGRT